MLLHEDVRAGSVWTRIPLVCCYIKTLQQQSGSFRYLWGSPCKNSTRTLVHCAAFVISGNWLYLAGFKNPLGGWSQPGVHVSNVLTLCRLINNNGDMTGQLHLQVNKNGSFIFPESLCDSPDGSDSKSHVFKLNRWPHHSILAHTPHTTH